MLSCWLLFEYGITPVLSHLSEACWNRNMFKKMSYLFHHDKSVIES